MNPVLHFNTPIRFQAYFHEKQTLGGDMQQGWRVGVVIPARNEEAHIATVLETLPKSVDLAVVVNDGSTDHTERVAETTKITTEIAILNTGGIGVGGAIDAGHKYLIDQFKVPFVSVIMAGDGQMNPNDLNSLVDPVINGQFDHVKGDRSKHNKGYNQMPLIRKLASAILSFFTTLAAGQRIRDPQCGFTATSHLVLKEWNWNRSWNGYGYPNFWLINLAQQGWRIGHVPVESIYRAENSGIKPLGFFIRVGTMMAIEHHRRNISWLLGRKTSAYTFCAFISYILGWVVMVGGFSISKQVFWSIEPTTFLVTGLLWTIAHIFDRMATVAQHR